MGGVPGSPIPAAALPNDLPVDQLRLRSNAAGAVAVDPTVARWRYLAFRALELADGEATKVGGPGTEAVVVLVAGGGAEVVLGDRSLGFQPGRESPFTALPSAWYIPPGDPALVRARARGSASRTLLAIAEAPVSGRSDVAREPLVITPADVRVEIRGAGNATRQINHIVTPAFPADRLEVVEVLTPSGNWSSWPPHKHDVDDMPAEAVLEEIYYYRFPRSEGWGIQRLYRADRSRDGLWEVRTGDVVLVTDGYHPFTAAQGDDAWYLNALAGDRRTMACSYDPDYDWVREQWLNEPIDRRVPLVPPMVPLAPVAPTRVPFA
jgi:5-deoxy-glucuronate isomerase